MKTFEFTEDQVRTIAQCIKHRQGFLQHMNKLHSEMNSDEDTWSDYMREYHEKNAEQIACLQTLLNYINS